MRIFFYGLFMDESLLAAKGIVPSEVSSGFIWLKSDSCRAGAAQVMVACSRKQPTLEVRCFSSEELKNCQTTHNHHGSGENEWQ